MEVWDAKRSRWRGWGVGGGVIERSEWWSHPGNTREEEERWRRREKLQ